jgi:hypothetical protein
MGLMAKRLTTILLSLVVSLTACHRGQVSVAPAAELSPDEYVVLSAYIGGKFSEPEKQRVSQRVTKLVFLNMTQSGDDDLLRDENGRPVPWEKTVESLRKRAASLQQTTMDAFRKANSLQAFGRRSFHSPIDYELVDSVQLDAIFRKNGDWPAYYRQYPGSNGIVTWSRVGFSTDGTQALFYFSSHLH